MAKLGLLLLCVALVHTGYALQCYNCVSTATTKNCDDMADKDKITIATCGKTAGPGYISACIKKVVEDKATKNQNTTRACVLTKADATNRECDAASDRSNVLACEVCYDDLCNSVEGMHFSVMSLIASVFAGLLVKFIH